MILQGDSLSYLCATLPITDLEEMYTAISVHYIFPLLNDQGERLGIIGGL